MFRLALLLFSIICFAKNLSGQDLGCREDQAQELWNHIEATPYDVLPSFDSIGSFQSLKLLCPHFNNQAFLHQGNTMIKDRPKLVHSFGTTVRIAFVARDDSIFSGMFRSGNDVGILRLSLAVPPKKGIIVPGMGIKFFVDNHSPVNILAMPSLEGQKEANLFAHSYSTVIEPPRWSDITGSIVNFAFKRGLRQAGYSSESSTTALSNYHLASLTADGTQIALQTVPYILIFQPTPEAQQLLTDLSDGAQFREALEGKGNDIALFDVYGAMTPEGHEFKIGTIKTTSNFTASSFGDKELFFKHPEPLLR